jgi:hypothetical protein
MKNDIINKLKAAASEIQPSPELLERGKEHIRIQINSRGQRAPTISPTLPKKSSAHVSLFPVFAVIAVIILVLIAVTTVPGLEAVRKNLEGILPDFLKPAVMLHTFDGPSDEIGDVELKKAPNYSEQALKNKAEVAERRSAHAENKEELHESQGATVFFADANSSSTPGNGLRPVMIETQKKVVDLPDGPQNPEMAETRGEKKSTTSPSTNKRDEKPSDQ